MAFLNTITGEYIKLDVLSMQERDVVHLRTYESVEHRNIGDTKYKKSTPIRVFLTESLFSVLCKYLNNDSKSCEENFQSACYEYLATLEPYSGYESC